MKFWILTALLMPNFIARSWWAALEMWFRLMLFVNIKARQTFWNKFGECLEEMQGRPTDKPEKEGNNA